MKSSLTNLKYITQLHYIKRYGTTCHNISSFLALPEPQWLGADVAFISGQVCPRTEISRDWCIHSLPSNQGLVNG